jgi:anti-anti-sigma factor
MKLSETIFGKTLVILVEGRLDGLTSAELEQRLQSATMAGVRRIVLDLAGLDYISSAGLRVLLVSAKKHKAQGRELVLCAVPDNLYEIFDISGFTSIFALYADAEEALLPGDALAADA